jgi:hypothetical protein
LRRLILLVLAASFARAPLALAADSRVPGFQVQADGLFYEPVGKVASQSNANLVAIFGRGGGAAVTATIGFSRHWSTGIRVADFSSKSTGGFAFTDLASPPGQAYPAGAGPFGIERELRVLPVDVLLEYRRTLGGRVEWSFDGGAGIQSTIGHLRLLSRDGRGELSSIAGYQKDPSWTLATSLAFAAPGNLDLVASGRLYGVLSGDGAVWVKSDDPAFSNVTLGIRYPHDTH